MAFPRKRAPVACNYCRHRKLIRRKRRCNGEKPRCGLCTEAGIDCQYPRVPQRPSAVNNGSRNTATSYSSSGAGSGAGDNTTETLLHRIEKLEARLRQQQPQDASPPRPDPSLPCIQRQQQQQELLPQAESPQQTRPPAWSNAANAGSPDRGRAAPIENGLSPTEWPTTPGMLSPVSSTPIASTQLEFASWTAPVPASSPTENAQPDRHAVLPPPQRLPHPALSTPSSPGLQRPATHTSSWPRPTPPSGGDYGDVTFAIPPRHKTTSSSMLSLAPVQRLIGEYPDDLFYQIESGQKPPALAAGDRPLHPISLELATLDLSTAVTDALLARFFAEAHPHFPILDVSSFASFFDSAIRGDADDDADTAVCLVVLALGKLLSSVPAGGDCTGMEYFAPAYHILGAQWIASFDASLSVPLGLVLASIYLGYVSYPLLAWKLVYMASINLQLVVSQAEDGSMSQEKNDTVVRLCWTVFLLECDILAEFHLPRSGIDRVIDRMCFPRFSQDIGRDGLAFLAVCSARHLLNRIHNTIHAAYSMLLQGSASPASPSASAAAAAAATVPQTQTPGTTHSASPDGTTTAHTYRSEMTTGAAAAPSVEAIVRELTRQLNSWYDSLPAAIRPDLDGPDTPRDLQDACLRMRFWSSRFILTRPCLVYAAQTIRTADQSPHEPLPAYISESAAVCVESCRRYVRTADHGLRTRSEYTYMMIQALLSAVLGLAIAATNTSLAHLVPDMDQLLALAQTSTQRWAAPHSSAEAIVGIFAALAPKLRLKQSLARAVRQNSQCV